MFITNFFLLVIMLVGLLCMHYRGVSTLALGSLLWEQVRCWGSQKAVVLFSPSANVISIRKGFIWLLLATIVVLVPMVHPADFLVSFLTQPHPFCFAP
jgi:hypothetical protein